MKIAQLARKEVQALTPYQSARTLGGQGDIWLNANESPFEHQYNIDGAALNRYSECQPKPLIAAYAKYAGVCPEQVLTSRGADESIDLLIRTFCETGQDRILFCPPTYGMYRISAQINEIAQRIVPLTADWQLNLPEIANNLDTVKLLFVCSPNNPTGNVIPRQDIIALLKMTEGRAVVVIDEAYIDFCPEASMVTLLDNHPNLVILRTLSKAFALAGLRCGFTLAHPDIITLMLKIIAPYPVPVPVEHIACQALSDAGISRMKHQVMQLNSNRAYLQTELESIPGVTVFSGRANYLLVSFPHAQPLFEHLWDNGIILRRTPIENAIRISIGQRDECEKTARSIRQHLAQ